ncbi:transposase [Propioniciclava soli]|uniref:transposase n=1 Tax=Propioniciclava soli TaxID=2775081 RepID=UPI0039F6A29C
MPAPRKYSDELRERAVRMVEEALREDPRLAHKRACSQVGERLGIPGGTIRNWIRQGVAGGRAPLAVTVTDDPAGRIAQLERENRELRRANAILKSASAFFAAELSAPRLVDRLHRQPQGGVRGRADLRRVE